jgi:hypothetical protein
VSPARQRRGGRPRSLRGPADHRVALLAFLEELKVIAESLMPFKSQAQGRKFAQLLVEGKISNQTFEEWNRETGGAKLPERVEPRGRRKSRTKPRSKPRSRHKAR